MADVTAKLAEALRLLHGKLRPNVNGADETYFFIGLREQVSMREMQQVSEALAAYEAAQAEPRKPLPSAEEIERTIGFRLPAHSLNLLFNLMRSYGIGASTKERGNACNVD